MSAHIGGMPASAPATPNYDIIVLLVDDQPIVGEAIRRALAGEPDIRFHYCAYGKDAVSSAEQIKPTVILHDLVMPGVDGLTLVRAYRADAATKSIPIIVLSTKEDPAVKSEAFEAGANDYIVKLPDNLELIARIRHHSKAYINQLQRDEAYRALRVSQQLLVEKNLELERLTNVDGLTGLSNRRYFNEFTSAQWKHAVRERQPYAILMVDVDDFKRYNDTYGHLAGDEVLKTVAKAVRSCCERPTDLVARFGGEEFVACLPSALAGATIVGERMCRAVRATDVQHSGSTVAAMVTVSIGCASTNPHQGESHSRPHRSGRRRFIRCETFGKEPCLGALQASRRRRRNATLVARTRRRLVVSRPA